MRRSLLIGALLMGGACSALAAPRAADPLYVSMLIREYHAYDLTCRGALRPNTDAVCTVRQKISQHLFDMGVCYSGIPRSNAQWGRCTSEDRRAPDWTP